MSEADKDFLDEVTGLEAPEQPEKVEPEKPEPEKGDVPVQPEPEVTPTPEAKKEETVPLPALRAEREKRQALERRLAEIEAKQRQEQVPSFFEHPDQHVQHLFNQVQQNAEQRLYAALEEQARDTYSDYDEVFAEVMAHAAENPAIVPQVMNAPNPALAAYRLGKDIQARRQMQNPDEYRAKLKAEVLAELRAEQEAKEAAKRRAAESIPPNLANVRSGGAPIPGDQPADFSDLFPKR